MNKENVLFAYYTWFFSYLFSIDSMAQLIIVCLLALTVSYTKILLFFS